MSEVSTVPNRADRHDPTKAREALAAKFATPEEKSKFYRAIGARGNAGRLVLAAEDAAALRCAYSLLARLAEKYQLDAHPVVVVTASPPAPQAEEATHVQE